jgi:hypothetical protein
MAIIAALATLVLWAAIGFRFAAGVLLGCAVAWVNFWWLKRAVHSFADKVTRMDEQQARKSRSGLWFLMRYALIGVGAYVILKSSIVSASGFFAGLFLPVPAIIVEAVYETAVALRHNQ